MLCPGFFPEKNRQQCSSLSLLCLNHTVQGCGLRFRESLLLIRGRNEVVAKVMFLLVSVILLTGGLPQCMLGYPPGAATPQSRHSPGADPPPPGADPPGADTPPEQTPPEADTPQSRHPPGADPPWEQTPPQADTSPLPEADSGIR